LSVYFIGCLHLGHKNLIENVRGMSVKDHDEIILENLNKLTKRDKVFILGDLSMENRNCWHELYRLKCVTHVVLGNHDRYQDVKYLNDYVDQVSGCMNYKDCILTHMPIHPMCLEGERFKMNIHAHIHRHTVDDDRYFNVDAQRLNYKPISFDEIRSRS